MIRARLTLMAKLPVMMRMRSVLKGDRWVVVGGITQIALREPASRMARDRVTADNEVILLRVEWCLRVEWEGETIVSEDQQQSIHSRLDFRLLRKLSNNDKQG